MTKVLALLPLLVASTAAADTIGANPNDPGKVTHIEKGVKELNLGGIFVYSVDKVEDTTTSRFSALGGPGFQYFFNANVSAGAQGLISYDKVGDASAVSAASSRAPSTRASASASSSVPRSASALCSARASSTAAPARSPS